MFRQELIIPLLIVFTQILSEQRDYYAPYNKYEHQKPYQKWDGSRMAKEVRVKQGRLRGFVVRPRVHNQALQLVDVFLGVPYAEPPIGVFRFSPTRSPQPWRDVRIAKEFAPVCPQLLPNLKLEVMPGRHDYLERLLPYLKNQDEDCLYLNIYAPHQSDGQSNPRKYPVMVFIHGESYEWNSGNFYDGTLLSSYGNIVFVTLNYRLGILGFLRPGTNDDTASNFGLLDQTAALLWLRENIAKFGGDPDAVTLVGHGTGATLVNLLMISPVAKDLFKRAILMSGSALSADAIGQAPLQITEQIAHALNCPVTSDTELAKCLRERDIESLLNAPIHKPRYVPAFAPLIDRAVIPSKPLELMQNIQQLSRFDLMYGVTESEKVHILSQVAISQGLSDDERDTILRDHARATYEFDPDTVLAKILDHYGEGSFDGYSDNMWKKNRDIVLDTLSDSGTVAPLVLAGKLHARANPKSYMYVFSHRKAISTGEYREHTVHGEEIPYMLGVPLTSGANEVNDLYNIGEALLSEAMMTWWCNFAHTGNPNAPRRTSYLTDGRKMWEQYQMDWLEFDGNREQLYLNLTIPPNIGTKYRAAELEFWNTELPNSFRQKPRRPRPYILDRADGIAAATHKSSKGYDMKYTTTVPHNLDSYGSADNNDYIQGKFFPHSKESGNIKLNEPSDDDDEVTYQGSSTITMIIGFGVAFLLINITAFIYFYRKRLKSKNKDNNDKNTKRRIFGKSNEGAKKKQEKYQENVELCRKCDSKPDINEVIKNDKAYDNSSNFGRRSKLSRQNSSSTIDTHIKVKEWIQQEIVQRCSPRFLRKTREQLQKEYQEKMSRQQEIEEEETRRSEEELLNSRKLEPIYDETPLIVRPGGKKPKVPKVSVAIDATPATRTESILNQIPIELAKDMEAMGGNAENMTEYESNYVEPQMTPQVVVIEHHHSRSDPLPMNNIIKGIKPNFSTLSRTYESDSGSASSLYAKINPKLKSRLPQFAQRELLEEEISNDTCDGFETPKPNDDDIYSRIPKMTTFGVNNGDINVTSCDPIKEREVISPEEALKTIKRRNYPKVLPDIEKRRSLPAPNTLYSCKPIGNSLKDHRQGPHPSCKDEGPPVPPPRLFGTSKSLDLPEEDETPVTTNLHVGPLLKRQDSLGKNHSDTSIIDSIERVAMDAQQVLSDHRDEYMEMTPNAKCPVHGKPSIFSNQGNASSTSRSVDDLDRKIDSSDWYPKPNSTENSKGLSKMSLPNVSVGNPNWYRTMRKAKDIANPYVQYGEPENDKMYHQMIPKEPRIVITPRKDIPGQDSTLPQLIVNPNPLVPSSTAQQSHLDSLSRSNEVYSTPKGSVMPSESSLNVTRFDRHEPQIVIAPAAGTLKQPKIIIKPTTNAHRYRERNIPKVSAIPSPEAIPNFQFNEKDIKTVDELKSSDKPPIKKKPNVSRIPSFTKRREEHSTSDQTNPGIYPEKVEIVQRVNDSTSTEVSIPLCSDNKSSIPTLRKDSVTPEFGNNAGNLDSNTNTIKRKPVGKK